MMCFKKILFLSALVFAGCFSIAQEIKNTRATVAFRAVHWGLEEGLSQGETYFMIKDVNGFLWIGTRYGLNRFDGHTFKVYTHQRNNDKSLIYNSVIGGLIEDSLHNIWVGSDIGLSRYNIRTDDFTNFFPDTNPFWATKNEVLCIERQSLITSYNIHTSQKKVLANLKGFEDPFIGPSATYSIFDSSTNTIWCLVSNPEFKAILMEVSLFHE
jgi:hypothetical protein